MRGDPARRPAPKRYRGAVTSRQAALRTGTALLADDSDMPRVLCARGITLSPAGRAAGAHRRVGGAAGAVCQAPRRSGSPASEVGVSTARDSVQDSPRGEELLRPHGLADRLVPGPPALGELGDQQ
ncbi:DUF6777 domain-containing protein [Streptomyces sp. NPDC048581]|uniref:DUF6777 domain-containing protein n=1 Tax=unclassified Streptomyces TaxID=2593676 RepID=UPI00371F0BA5